MIGVLVLVFAFRSSTALAYAFGMAVTGTIVITTVLFFYVVRQRWGKPLWLVIAGAGFFLIFEGLFFAANLTKISHGAWLPLLIGLVVFTVMITWQHGRELVTERREHEEGSLSAFVDDVDDAGRRYRECPAPRCSSTAASTRRPWPCEPTWSTTTSCTSRS